MEKQVNGPGIYKVKTFLGYERMRVYLNQENELMYSVSSTPSKHVSEMDSTIKILRKVETLEPVLHAKFHISWKDRELDEFKISATSTARFRQIIDDLPDVLAVLKDPYISR